MICSRTLDIASDHVFEGMGDLLKVLGLQYEDVDETTSSDKEEDDPGSEPMV